MPRSVAWNQEQIAQLYLECVALKLPITPTIAEVMNCSEHTARYMVRKAKDGGFLGVEPHMPIVATMRRGTPRERKFLMCDYCDRKFWPCKYAFPYRPDVATITDGDDFASDTELE